MVTLKTFFKRVLVVIGVLALTTTAFFIGRFSVSDGGLDAAYSDAASFLKKGSPTFCALNEQARMFVCPAVRIYMTSSNGGSIVIYQCNSRVQNGYLEMINLTQEEGNAVLKKLTRSGMRYDGHCIENGSIVYRIYAAGGRRDAIPRSI